MALSHPLYIGMLATGKIKKYQIVMGGIMIGGVCVCCLAFKFDYGPEWCYYSVIIVALIQLFVRLKLLEEMIDGFSGVKYFKETIIRVLAVIIPIAILLFLIRRFSFNSSALEFLLVLLADAMIMPLLIYALGLKQTERVVVRNKIGSNVQKFLRK